MTQSSTHRLLPPAIAASVALLLCGLSPAALAVETEAPLAASSSPGERRWKPEPLPREREIAAALAAGPAALAQAAGVYVLEQHGYVLVRPSRNGFHCLVGRDLPGAFEPQCFDAEGSQTLLRQLLLAAELRMGGASDGEIERAVGAAWASGELKAPRRPGVNYMLSPENRVPMDAEGRIAPYRPHVMFYAPYLTNADLGAEPMGSSPIFVINEGGPAAYVIVPVPEEAAAHGETH